ncbi:hypothetical protein K439DRAFT_1385260 [Ramaria rubella]|nr:hypothetical protein K439DRAFT_1385260 [Ramaria rubella]
MSLSESTIATSGDGLGLLPPLSTVMYELLFLLGRLYAAEGQRVLDRDWSSRFGKERRYFNKGSCCRLAYYILGDIDFDFVTWLSDSEEKNRTKMIWNALPQSSPKSLENMIEIYKSAVPERHIGTTMFGYHDESWITKVDKEKLARNAQDFDWCSNVWSQLVDSGASARDIVEHFVMIIFSSAVVQWPLSEFPSQWYARAAARTSDELKIIDLSARIREKHDWRVKINNENIVSKWRKEAYEQDITPSMFDFLLAELHWFSGECDPETGIEHAAVPGVFHSDSLVCSDDRDALRTGSNSLVATSRYKDWHPGSDEQVLDLVHPSLYPYIRGRTRRFKFAQDQEVSKFFPPVRHASHDSIAASVLQFIRPSTPPRRFSSPMAAVASIGSEVPISGSDTSPDMMDQKWQSDYNYQWLPVDVLISGHSAHCSAQFLSYINNLHPSPQSASGLLYGTLERIFARFVPLFERTLTDTRLGRHRNGKNTRPEFLFDSYGDYWSPTESAHENESMACPEDRGSRHEEWRRIRQYVRPVVKPFIRPDPPGEAQVRLGDRTVQVIVKMANVHLTPDKPEYPGGSWHVEGTDTECIVATGIYYYESDNITDSLLSFRQAVEDPPYIQDEYDHFEKLYGIINNDEDIFANQFLGTVTTPKDRCICFPNGMQHHLSPFKLIDPTKPGHRKTLVFFLIDPNQRVMSTSEVLPQQLEWFLHEIRCQTGTRLTRLPPELFDLICDAVRSLVDEDFGRTTDSSQNWLIGLEEAEAIRSALMTERALFSESVDEEIYGRMFNLCEH